MYVKSKHQNDLWFQDKPPGRALYFEHQFDGYSLEARVLFNGQDKQPWILSIHGARADLTKSDAVTFGLQKRGYSVLGMNMSGHGKAGALKPEQTTLANNVHEANTFFDYLDKNRQKVVIGYSLGGTPT